MTYKLNPFTGKLDTSDGPQGPAGVVSAAGPGSQGTPSISFAADLDTGLYNYTPNGIAVSTGGTGRLFVDASGNVGINRAPTRELTVHSPDNNNAIIQFTNDDTGLTASNGILFGLDGNENCFLNQQEASKDIIVYTAGTGEKLRITSDGKVGLGTSSPGAKLDVWPATSDAAFRGNSGISVQVPAFEFIGYNTNTSNGGLDIRTNLNGTFTDKVRITNDGLVGIGTQTPGEELQIGSTTSASSTSPVTLSLGGQYTPQASISLSNLKLKVYDSSTDSAGFTAGQDGLSYVCGKGQQHIWYRADGAGTLFESFRSDTSGRLLVGTSSASTGALAQYSKLQILGNTSSSASGAQLNLGRNETSANVGDGELLGRIHFTDNQAGEYATIQAEADGTPAVGDHPGRLVFSTTAASASTPTERMRIDSAGTLKTFGSTADASVYNCDFRNSASTDLFRVRNDGYFITGSAAGSPYNLTTGNAANVNIDSNGGLQRVTSSLKYKRDVQDAVHGLAELLQLRAVTYKGKGQNDGETVFGGLIAEEVDAAGLHEFVQYAEDGSPDALAYSNMVSLCIKAIQEQQAMITELQTKVAALEGV